MAQQAHAVGPGQRPPGHKRLNRYESGCDRAHYIKLQNYCIDMFGEIIEPDWDYAIGAPADIKGYLEAYLNWEDNVYTRLAAISNELIVMGFPCEAELVREGLPRKEVEKVRRMLTEYDLSGWDMTYILLKDKELHDKVKEMEEAGQKVPPLFPPPKSAKMNGFKQLAQSDVKKKTAATL